MEVEKPFKCSICNAQFTNEDHLAVHKRRHEMSLNLKSEHQLQTQSSLDSFVDETPTPTRFFRNCEEVGLFQDLQNVNPFDEQFAKAASTAGTPSTNVEPFDFNIIATSTSNTPATGSASSSSSKRRYSDQDTLNTPQVFGYVLNTTTSTSTTNASATTTTILNPMPSSSSSASQDKISISSDSCSNSNVENSPEKIILQSKEEIGAQDSKGRSKVKLRLNLSPTTPIIESNVERNSDPPTPKRVRGDPLQEKKVELLERNRAAATRSRYRRKQWISNLETKCGTLERLLTHTRAELMKQWGENQALRNELYKHVNCDVTRAESDSSNQNQQIHILVQKQPQPNILRQVVQPSTSTVVDIQKLSQIVTTPVTIVPCPPPKPKRGRPRKGQERRAQLVDIPTPSASAFDVPIKIQLLPLAYTKNEVRNVDE